MKMCTLLKWQRVGSVDDIVLSVTDCNVHARKFCEKFNIS